MKSKQLGGMLIVGLGLFSFAQEDVVQPEWVSVFDGKTLDGWTAKIASYAYGNNFGDTFRVEDGVIKIDYSAYENNFGKRFGALYFGTPLSRYVFRMEYRFVGDMPIDGSESWALMDGGIQIHSPEPSAMADAQEFPISVEMNLIGDDGTGRLNGNVCSPSTHVYMDDVLNTTHCIATSKVVSTGNEWTKVEVEVLGNESFKFFVDGVLTSEFQKPILDEDSPLGKAALEGGLPLELSEGYLSLQSNGHAMEFRNLELMDLSGQ